MSLARSIAVSLACLALVPAACSEESQLDTGPFVPVCEAASEAGCSDGFDKCTTDWAKAEMRCPDEVDAMVECAGDSPTATCNGDVALFDGCEAETSEAILCAIGGG